MAGTPAAVRVRRLAKHSQPEHHDLSTDRDQLRRHAGGAFGFCRQDQHHFSNVFGCDQSYKAKLAVGETNGRQASVLLEAQGVLKWQTVVKHWDVGAHDLQHRRLRTTFP